MTTSHVYMFLSTFFLVLAVVLAGFADSSMAYVVLLAYLLAIYFTIATKDLKK